MQAQQAEKLLLEAQKEGDTKLEAMRQQQYTIKKEIAIKEREEALEAVILMMCDIKLVQKHHRDKAITALLDDLADAYRSLGRCLIM